MAAMASGITLRIRSQIGMWRFSGVDPNDTVEHLQQRLVLEKNIPIHQQKLSLDPSGHQLLSANETLRKYGISSNGDMLHLAIDSNASILVAGTNMVSKKTIAADGSIVAVEYEASQQADGFRPGMPRLRDIKNSWTLSDFLEMDEQFVYRFAKIKEGEGNEDRKSEMCLGAQLHLGCMQDFTASLQAVGWSQCRMAFLYGTIDEEASKVCIEAMYEPPQEVSPDYFELLEDPREEQVDRLVDMLGLRKVGWVYAHPPREEGFLMSAKEIMFAGYQQLEAADGVNRTPFVSIRMSPDESGSSSVDALQVTLQCMDMVAEGALEEDPKNRSSCGIVSTFTAVVEGKEGVKTVDATRFLLNVPVLQNETPKLHCLFPPVNRIGAEPQTFDALKTAISQNSSVTEALKDFNL